jgi:hypothetical protein
MMWWVAQAGSYARGGWVHETRVPARLGMIGYGRVEDGIQLAWFVGIRGLACGVRRGVGGMRGVCDRRAEERRMHSRVDARWRVGVGTTDGVLMQEVGIDDCV